MKTVKQDTRGNLLNAALSVLAERGLDSFAVDAVVARSGISTGSLYHHFGGRQGLLAALFVEGVADHGRRALIAMESEASLEEGIRALVATYLTWISEQPVMARFLLSARGLVQSEAGPALKELNRDYFRRLRHWLEQWPETRALARQPVFALAQIYGPSEYLARLWLDGVLPGAPSDHAEGLARAATAAITGTATKPH